MFDIGWSELLILGIVAIVVVGPKDLPKLMRVVGQYVGWIRKMAQDFRKQINDAIDESELSEMRKSVEDISRSNPLDEVEKSINDHIRDPIASVGDDNGTGEAIEESEPKDLSWMEGVEGPVPGEASKEADNAQSTSESMPDDTSRKAEAS